MVEQSSIKPKMKRAFMDIAKRFASLSTAKRLQVGAIVVKDDRIVSIGYNGMPSGWDNNCEHVVAEELKTRPEVLHAEANAITKLAKSHESGNNAAIFVTHSPCIECAKLIYQSGINRIYYETDYRSNDGILFLRQCNLIVEKMEQ